MTAVRTDRRAPFATDAARLDAVRRRDPAADGHFLVSVSTTGVYCHPWCPSRPALPQHLAFHDTRADAERAGFRACKRCRPDLPPRGEREAAVIAEACRIIEAADEPPALATLAAQLGLSAHHFHRTFKRITGVTPRAYAAARRDREVRDALAAGAAVTEALYAAGFNSSGRFYEIAPGILGMTPSAYRRGGQGEAVSYVVCACSLGWVLVATTERGICAILLGDNPAGLAADLEARFLHAAFVEPSPDFVDRVAAVVRVIEEPERAPDLALPLDIRGTAFQRSVWEAIRAIPAGETASYAEVADRIGMPLGARAVGGACGKNTHAVVIPCHRVIASDGGLGGFGWGLDLKRRLLEREQR